MRIRTPPPVVSLLALAAAACVAGPTRTAQPSAAPSAAPPASPSAASPRTPSAPHERLTFFEGTWTVEELPPARRYREQCTWLPEGRRHLVCRNRSVSAAGEPREGMSLVSYRDADSTYLYYGLGASGAVEVLEGRATTDGWEFRGTRGTGPMAERERVRVSIARLPAGRFRFIEQTARGAGMFSAGDTIHYRPLPAAHWEP